MIGAVHVGYGKGRGLRGGYGEFWISPKLEFAHRIAYFLDNGALDDDKYVLHRCDNPQCVKPSHLYLGTQSDNNKDAYARRRRKATPPDSRGANNSHVRLTRDQVLEIKTRRRDGERGVDLAREYGISPQHVANIMNGQRRN